MNRPKVLILLLFCLGSCSIPLSQNVKIESPESLLSAKEIFNKIDLSYVKISVSSVDFAGQVSRSSGTGVVIKVTDTGSYILTAAHVVKMYPSPLSSIRVITFDSKDNETEYLSKIVTVDDDGDDLALLFTKGLFSKSVITIADSDPDLYENVYSLGAALGYSRLASIGILSSKNEGDDGRHIWEVSNGTFIFGCSGGPATNSRGELIGIIKSLAVKMTPVMAPKALPFPMAVPTPFPGMGFITPLPAIKEFLNKMIL